MNRLFTYIAESRAELTKVNGPNRQTTVQLTILVIVFSLVLAAFIGGLDYLFSIGLQRLIVKG
jgi:preprotein translocase SecE subunit